jgi:opacity protein-like surface antigen
VGSDTLNGTVFGIGVEHRVGGHLSVSLEYLKTDLGRFDLTGLCSVDSCYTDIEFGQTQLGLNYRW